MFKVESRKDFRREMFLIGRDHRSAYYNAIDLIDS